MIKILIAAPPGYFRSSLAALVRTFSQAQVMVTGDSLSNILESAGRFPPDILILDSKALDGVFHIHNALPGCKLLFMADHIRHQGDGWYSSGAEVVLSKSASMGELLVALRSLTAEHHPVEREPVYNFV